MTFDDLIEYYDTAISFIKRTIDFDRKNVDFYRGYLEGTYRIINHLLTEHSITDLPELIKTSKKDEKKFKLDSDLLLVYKIKVLGVEYPIYLDDNGQCYGIVIDDKNIGFGTYNTEIQLVALFEIFENIYKNDSISIFMEK